MDPIITYNNGSTAALLATKDELGKQMNFLKRNLLVMKNLQMLRLEIYLQMKN